MRRRREGPLLSPQLTPATLHTHTHSRMVIYVLNQKTRCAAPTVAFLSITSMIKALKEDDDINFIFSREADA